MLAYVNALCFGETLMAVSGRCQVIVSVEWSVKILSVTLVCAWNALQVQDGIFISLFSVVAVCICKSWFVFCGDTMLLWAGSWLLGYIRDNVRQGVHYQE